MLDEARRLWDLFKTEYGSSEVVYGILQAHRVELFAYYLPGQWHPHITVAMDDLGDADFVGPGKTCAHTTPATNRSRPTSTWFN